MPISPYYGSDYVVMNSGATFALLADGIYDAGLGATLYAQYSKLSFGLTGAYTAVSTTNPLPVTVSAGLTANISGFCGSIQVEGMASGTPVAVSGTVVVTGLSASPLYVQTPANCYVEVTGGIPLTKTRDAVSVFGPSGSTWIFANLVGGSGSAIGVSGNALNVNVVGASINATVGTTLSIQGFSGGYAVAINDTNILAGMTSIYGQVVGLRSDLSALGVGRPSTFKTGRLSMTSASVSQMDSGGYTTTAAISIKALSTNTDFVYLGNTSGLIGSSFGYALDPGETVAMNVTNTNKIYAISNTGTQVITYLAT